MPQEKKKKSTARLEFMRCFWCKNLSSSSGKVINPVIICVGIDLTVSLFVFHKLFHKLRIVQDWGSPQRTDTYARVWLCRALFVKDFILNLIPKSPESLGLNVRVMSAVSWGDQFNFLFFFSIRKYLRAQLRPFYQINPNESRCQSSKNTMFEASKNKQRNKVCHHCYI